MDTAYLSSNWLVRREYLIQRDRTIKKTVWMLTALLPETLIDFNGM